MEVNSVPDTDPYVFWPPGTGFVIRILIWIRILPSTGEDPLDPVYGCRGCGGRFTHVCQ
jgi:hypothetical protein